MVSFFPGMPFHGISGLDLVISFVRPTTVGAGGNPFHGGLDRLAGGVAVCGGLDMGFERVTLLL